MKAVLDPTLRSALLSPALAISQSTAEIWLRFNYAVLSQMAYNCPVKVSNPKSLALVSLKVINAPGEPWRGRATYDYLSCHVPSSHLLPLFGRE